MTETSKTYEVRLTEKELREPHGWRCVKCGNLVTGVQVAALHEIGLPPACPEHEDDIKQALKANASMWPSKWYGHALQRRGGIDRWIITLKHEDWHE